MGHMSTPKILTHDMLIIVMPRQDFKFGKIRFVKKQLKVWISSCHYCHHSFVIFKSNVTPRSPHYFSIFIFTIYRTIICALETRPNSPCRNPKRYHIFSAYPKNNDFRRHDTNKTIRLRFRSSRRRRWRTPVLTGKECLYVPTPKPIRLLCESKT